MRGKESGRQRRGFTLIEILCVCIILAIAAKIAIPYVSNGYNDVKLTAAGRSFMADLYYAQNLAITNQQNVFVVFTAATSTAGGSYSIKSGATAAAATVVKNPSDGLDYTQYLGSCSASQLPLQRPTFANSKLGTLPGSITAFGFDYMGQPINADGTIMASIPGAAPTDDASKGMPLPLKSLDGAMTLRLYVQLYSGELAADKAPSGS